MTPISAISLLTRLDEEMTKGEWEYIPTAKDRSVDFIRRTDSGETVCDFGAYPPRMVDAECIATLRNALPALASCIREVVEERDRALREAAFHREQRDKYERDVGALGSRLMYERDAALADVTHLTAELAAARAECERLRKESDDLSRYHLEEFARYKQARNEQHERYDVLHAQFTTAQATLTKECVEHSELNGHIEIVEQCRDYLNHETMDEGDPSGKLQDFANSLRIVIDQLDRQRRRANWYEAAHEAGKQKLIESAVEKRLESARAAARRLVAAVDDLAAFADDNDPRVMATAGPIGAAHADLYAALGLDLDAEHARLQADIESRCAVCGWTLAESADEGCVRGNCSYRPRPTTLYALERAKAESVDKGQP